MSIFDGLDWEKAGKQNVYNPKFSDYQKAFFESDAFKKAFKFDPSKGPKICWTGEQDPEDFDAEPRKAPRQKRLLVTFSHEVPGWSIAKIRQYLESKVTADVTIRLNNQGWSNTPALELVKPLPDPLAVRLRVLAPEEVEVRTFNAINDQ